MSLGYPFSEYYDNGYHDEVPSKNLDALSALPLPLRELTLNHTGLALKHLLAEEGVDINYVPYDYSNIQDTAKGSIDIVEETRKFIAREGIKLAEGRLVVPGTYRLHHSKAQQYRFEYTEARDSSIRVGVMLSKFFEAVYYTQRKPFDRPIPPAREAS